MKLNKLLDKIVEALKPSEYRPYVKNWDKSRYEELFKSHHSTDKKHYRIYLPLHGEKKEVHPIPEVVAAVKEAGYEIADYMTGIATKIGDPKRQIKIGKLIKDQAVQNKFANDPQRRSSKTAEFYIVISRHPYDLAGMSTDRGWRSCMNLKDGINRHYVPLDIKEGTLIAYVVKADDKNINRPVGRVLIKPFVNISKPNEVALGVENLVYGTDVPGFRKQVMDWAEEVNSSRDLNGIFELNNKLYNDGGLNRTKMIGKNFTDEERIYHDPMSIRDMKDPPERLQLVAVTKDPHVIQYIKKPSKAVILKALEKGVWIMGMIQRAGIEIPKEVIEDLFEKDPAFIQYIENPTLEQFKDAFDRGGTTVLYYIMTKNPPLEFLMWALAKNPHVLRYFEKHTDELHDYMIDHHVKANDPGTWAFVRDMKNVSKKTIEKLIDLAGGHKILKHLNFYDNANKITKKQGDAAVKEDPTALYSIPTKYVSPDVQLEAAKKEPKLVNYIKRDLRDKIIEENPDAIKHITTGNEMTGKMSQSSLHLAWIAVKKKPEVLRNIDMPPEDMVQYCVDKDPDLLFAVRTKYWPIKAMAQTVIARPDRKKDIENALKKSRMHSRKWKSVEEEIDRLKRASGNISVKNKEKYDAILDTGRSSTSLRILNWHVSDIRGEGDDATVILYNPHHGPLKTSMSSFKQGIKKAAESK